VANVKNNSASQETCRRLLLAAGEVFAERGYHAATIKDITDRAGASLASVNYHFRDKAELYAAVLRRIQEDAAFAVPVDDPAVADPAERLRNFVQMLCINLLGRERFPWEPVLMAREAVDPSQALHMLLENAFKPLNDKLCALISEAANLPQSDEQVAFIAASIFGQIVYYLKHPHTIQHMHPQFTTRPSVERIAGHIADFSLAGIRANREAAHHAAAEI
jgi:TetR/AcrR family transcriptional regulator, regulator of cefoperazone and chloramphenicol sensitivity